MKVNSWDEFQPLEQVVLGSYYDSLFFGDIKNTKIKDVLVKIADETAEDLDFFKTQMKSHNIDVVQFTPRELGYKDNILDYADIDGRIGLTNNDTKVKNTLTPAPPLEPRDHMIVMGNKIVITDPVFNVQGYRKKFKEYFGPEYVDDSLCSHSIKFKRGKKSIEGMVLIKNLQLDEKQKDELAITMPLCGFCSPNITRIGKKCFVDITQTPDAIEFLEEKYPQFAYEKIELGGHNDSIFGVIKPGVVLASNYLMEQNYHHIFDKWEVVYFDDPNWDKVVEFGKLRYKNQGKWWVPDQENNDEFTHFVEFFLENLTGQVDETIFDVNVLVIDDKHVVVNSYSEKLFETLKRHNMEPIVCPLRHRFFFDGGWHCLTLDVKRKGGQNDYGI